MESKSTFFILIVVVAVLTLALAALAGYIFLVQGTAPSKAATQASANVKSVPSEDQLTTVSLFDGKRYFNLKNDDSKKIAIIQANVSLKCFAQIKEEKKTSKAEEIITSYSPEIQELVVKFFLNMTEDQIKSPDQLDKASDALKKQINDLLNEGKNNKQDVVYKVIFSEWLFQ